MNTLGATYSGLKLAAEPVAVRANGLETGEASLDLFGAVLGALKGSLASGEGSLLDGDRPAARGEDTPADAEPASAPVNPLLLFAAASTAMARDVAPPPAAIHEALERLVTRAQPAATSTVEPAASRDAAKSPSGAGSELTELALVPAGDSAVEPGRGRQATPDASSVVTETRTRVSVTQRETHFAPVLPRILAARTSTSPLRAMPASSPDALVAQPEGEAPPILSAAPAVAPAVPGIGAKPHFVPVTASVNPVPREGADQAGSGGIQQSAGSAPMAAGPVDRSVSPALGEAAALLSQAPGAPERVSLDPTVVSRPGTPTTAAAIPNDTPPPEFIPAPHVASSPALRVATLEVTPASRRAAEAMPTQASSTSPFTSAGSGQGKPPVTDTGTAPAPERASTLRVGSAAEMAATGQSAAIPSDTHRPEFIPAPHVASRAVPRVTTLDVTPAPKLVAEAVPARTSSTSSSTSAGSGQGTLPVPDAGTTPGPERASALWAASAAEAAATGPSADAPPRQGADATTARSPASPVAPARKPDFASVPGLGSEDVSRIDNPVSVNGTGEPQSPLATTPESGSGSESNLAPLDRSASWIPRAPDPRPAAEAAIAAPALPGKPVDPVGPSAAARMFDGDLPIGTMGPPAEASPSFVGDQPPPVSVATDAEAPSQSTEPFVAPRPGFSASLAASERPIAVIPDADPAPHSSGPVESGRPMPVARAEIAPTHTRDTQTESVALAPPIATGLTAEPARSPTLGAASTMGPSPLDVRPLPTTAAAGREPVIRAALGSGASDLGLDTSDLGLDTSDLGLDTSGSVPTQAPAGSTGASPLSSEPVRIGPTSAPSAEPRWSAHETGSVPRMIDGSVQPAKPMSASEHLHVDAQPLRSTESAPLIPAGLTVTDALGAAPSALVSSGSNPQSFAPIPTQQVADAILGQLPPRPAEGAGVPGMDGPLRILTLQLHPADLGTVLVRMRLRGGQLEMSLHASREETATLLREGGEVLGDLLRQGGYQPERVTILSGAPATVSAGVEGQAFRPQADAGGNPNHAAPDQPGRRQPDGREAAASDTSERIHDSVSNSPDRSGVYL